MWAGGWVRGGWVRSAGLPAGVPTCKSCHPVAPRRPAIPCPRAPASANIPGVPARFTLLDDAYYEALLRVTAALQRRGVASCLVGGAAVQAWVATLRTTGGALRLGDEPTLSRMLRPTRDLDFAARPHGSTRPRCS